MPTKDQIEACFIAAGFISGREGMGPVSESLIALGKELSSAADVPSIDRRSTREAIRADRVRGAFYKTIPSRVPIDYRPQVGDVVTVGDQPLGDRIEVEEINEKGFLKILGDRWFSPADCELRRPALLFVRAFVDEPLSYIDSLPIVIPAKIHLPPGVTMDLSGSDFAGIRVTVSRDVAVAAVKDQFSAELAAEKGGKQPTDTPRVAPADLYRAITGDDSPGGKPE